MHLSGEIWISPLCKDTISTFYHIQNSPLILFIEYFSLNQGYEMNIRPYSSLY